MECRPELLAPLIDHLGVDHREALLSLFSAAVVLQKRVQPYISVAGLMIAVVGQLQYPEARRLNP
jgi:hypothetical protein